MFDIAIIYILLLLILHAVITIPSAAAAASKSRGINNNKENTDLMLRRGFLRIELLDFQRASDDFTQVIRREPENGKAHFGLGNAKYQIGNVKGACAEWKIALDLGEDRVAEQISKFCIE